MTIKAVGWIVGAAALLAGAGVARGEEPSADTSQGENTAAAGEGAPVCRDMGVTVSFKRGSHELDTNAKGALNGVANWMGTNEKRTLELQGYTDPTGNADANMALSEKRAEAVENYLVQQGVSGDRVNTVGRGETTQYLPAEGRTVTMMGCQPPVKVAKNEEKAESTQAQAEATPPPAPPEPAPETAPPPVQETPPPVAAAPVQEIPPPPAQPYHDVGEAGWHPYGRGPGFAMLLGGGFEDFTHDVAKNTTGNGGSWNARVVVGTNSIIGLEAAYVGGARQLRPLGLSTNSNLVNNGAEAALRLNIPVRMGRTLIEPFGFAGIGWQHYYITNYANNVTADVSQRSDDTMTVPLGGGIAIAYEALMLDVRGSWTPTYYNQLYQSQSGALDHWGVGGNLGFVF
jgi:outer membrane protein OmpA-like peptidoglycan-associated protein